MYEDQMQTIGRGSARKAVGVSSTALGLAMVAHCMPGIGCWLVTRDTDHPKAAGC